jgi:hypothetical protein
MTRRPTARTAIWLAVGAGLLLLAGANAHLVYVAVTSQPACVDHVRTGDPARGGFSAAASACGPSRPVLQPERGRS